MISIAIPGFGDLRLEHLVCDFNGTLAKDGRLLPGVAELLVALAADVSIHVLTADTHGRAAEEMKPLRATLSVIDATGQAAAKRAYVEALGPERVVAIGNGRNDREMLRVARVGIAVVQAEGAACEALESADVIVLTALDALELLLNPLRLVATLRD